MVKTEKAKPLDHVTYASYVLKNIIMVGHLQGFLFTFFG
jgi:hypothetical protein